MPRELAFTSPPALAVAVGATTPVGQIGAEIWSTTALRRLVWTGTQWADAMGGGNAATATALQTARTINGVSFDGTANITLPTVNTTGDQSVGGVKTFTSQIVASGGVQSGGNNGFANATWFGGVRNPIWYFGNAAAFGISYFQGSSGRDGQDTIGLHPNGNATATGSSFAVNTSNAFVNNNVVLHAGNFTSYSPSLTGSGASGTWGISVSGNANTVTNGVYTTGDQTIGGVKTFTSNLGIGTTSPGYRLDASAGGSVGAVVDIARFYAEASSTAEARILFGTAANVVNAGIGAVTTSAIDSDLKFYTEGSGTLAERLRITSAGNVGIGTTSPGAKLSVLTDSIYAASFNTTNVASSTTGISIGGWQGSAPEAGGSVVIRAHHNHIGTAFSSMSFMTHGGSGLVERLHIDSAGNVLVTSNTGGLGYGTGAGGTVTQATSKSTAVTLNRPCGVISMNGEALAGNASVSFTLNNTLISTSDTVVVNMGFGSDGNYSVEATFVYGGGCTIRVTNLTGGSLSATPQIQFAIIKGATS